MRDFLYGLTIATQAVLIVGATVALSLAGLVLTRYVLNAETCRAHHDVTGYIYSTVGVLFAVLLAFAAAIVWQDSDRADEVLHREANAVADLKYAVGLLPDTFSDTVRDQIGTYVVALVEDEWPQMRTGRGSPRAGEALRIIFVTFGMFEPATKQQETIYAGAYQQLQNVAESRRLRLFAAGQRIHPAIWRVLVLGAAITIGYTYLFAPRSMAMRAIMTSALSASIGLIFFLIFALDYPFQDDVATAGWLRALLASR